jgi:hypothetical protein
MLLMPLVDYTRTKRPVFDVDLEADPYDRWQEVGRRNKAKLGRFLRDIETAAHALADDFVERNSTWLPDVLGTTTKWLLRTLLSGGGRLSGKAAALLARMFGEDYQAEIRGLAHASGLPESKLFLANLTYDLTVGHEGLYGACSSFSTVVAGAPVLVRNMDWAFPESTGRYTVMTRFHHGGANYVNIAPLGCVGVLSAMRPGAWAVTINQAPANGWPQIFQWPAMHRVRKACDSSLTFPTLLRHLDDYQTMTSFFAHVVGTKPSEQTVIESYADSFHRRRATAGRPLIQTNHYVSSFGHDLNPSKEADENGEYWDTYPRYDALAKRLRTTKPKSMREAIGILARSPVTHSATMNQMALRPASAEAIVRVRL